MWLLIVLCFILGQSAEKKAQKEAPKLGKNADWKYDFSLKHVSKGWGDTCIHGNRQSPIDLPDASALKEWKTSVPKIDWEKGRRVKIVGKDTGKTLRYTGADNVDLGKITLGTDDFDLKYFDLHMGSEHTIDGKQSALEIQFVHENAKSEKLILSILCDQSEDANTPTMNVFMNRLAGVQDGTKKEACPGDAFGKPMELDLHTSTIGRFEALKADKLFYRYIGSETTPPCKEKVKWMVMGATCRLKNAKIAEWLKKQDSLQNNFRPAQANNGRVLYVGPSMDQADEFKWPGKEEDTPKKKPVEEEKKKVEEEPKKKVEEEDKKEDEEPKKKTDEEKKKEVEQKKEDEEQKKNDEEQEKDDEKGKKEDAKETQKDDGKAEDKKDDGKSEDKKDDGKAGDDGKAEDKKEDGKTEDKKDDGKTEDKGKAEDKKDGEDSKEDSKADAGKDDAKGSDSGKEDKKEDGKSTDSNDTKGSDSKSKQSSHASASLHNNKINSHLVKPILGFALGFSVLLVLFCIFQKRQRNEYYDALIDDEV